MRQDQIDHEYDRLHNGIMYVSGWFLLFGFVFFSVVIIGSIIFVPMILNDLWMFGIVGSIVVFTFIRSMVVMNSRKNTFFKNPDVHTHTDNCPTCGVLFGAGTESNPPPYVRRMMRNCRHASGQMSYVE